MLKFLFSPSGRIGRGGWWLGHLVPIISFVIAILLLAIGLDIKSLSLVFGAVALAITCAWSGICLNIKRYHDRDKSAWWLLFQFIPIIGPIWALIELGFCAGTYGDNDYGPGPGLNIKDDLEAMLKDSEYSESYSTAQRMKQSTPSSYQPPKSTYSGGATFGKRG
jgi:uncharacterized membrane protein YhaH (DUF805 family)